MIICNFSTKFYGGQGKSSRRPRNIAKSFAELHLNFWENFVSVEEWGRGGRHRIDTEL